MKNAKSILKVKKLIPDILSRIWDNIEIEKFDVEIINHKTNRVVFKQNEVEFPVGWDYNDVTIVASKYFRGHVGDENREYSLRQVVTRVVSKITMEGIDSGYFQDEEAACNFAKNLSMAMKDRRGCFNSPVLFNFGWRDNPQASACFLLEVEDTIESLCREHQGVEANLFRGGSGAGVNVGNIRSSYEKLSKGGFSSGPIGFMKGWDSHAGALKSGGVCLAGNQKILTSSGVLTVKELAKYGKEFFSVSYTPGPSIDNVPVHGEFELKKSTAAYSGRKKVVRLITTRGDFNTSFDHPIRLKTGHYSQAKNVNQETEIHEALFNIKPDQIDFAKSRTCNEDINRAISKINKTGGDISHLCCTPKSNSLEILRVVELGIEDVYDVEVECDTVDDKSPKSGHNFILWPDRKTADTPLSGGITVSGLVVSNTRRAAKMVSMTDSHPDVLEQRDGSPGFIKVKPLEERKAKVLRATLNPKVKETLIANGLEFLKDFEFDVGFDGDVLNNLQHQNANYSIWISDAFMVNLIESYKPDSDNKFIVEHQDKTVEVVSIVDTEEPNWESEHEKCNITPVGIWFTREVKTGEVVGTYDIQEFFNELCKATWECGDPGLQFDGNINRLHSLLDTSRITRSNPCSEYISISKDVDPNKTIISDPSLPLTEQEGSVIRDKGSSCNLASLNLLKYINVVDTDKRQSKDINFHFDMKMFKSDIDLFVTAMDIICGFASYPTESIGNMSRRYREIGLGYTNLGTMLMYMGIPYDSEEGTCMCSAVTSLMNAYSKQTSCKLAKIKGAFEGYDYNKRSVLDVYKKFSANCQTMIQSIPPSFLCPGFDVAEILLKEADKAYKSIVSNKTKSFPYGFRNSKTTLLAPTGTISFMMGAETTGIEAELGLIKTKSLVGGGYLTQPNRIFEIALSNLGYDQTTIDKARDWIEENISTDPDIKVPRNTIYGCPDIKENHWKIFQTSFDPMQPLSYKAHVNMMAAAQCSLDGAISKTVNIPEDFSPDDIRECFIYAYEKGIKCIAIYRDNCKEQPLKTIKKSEPDTEVLKKENLNSGSMSKTRNARIHSVHINGISFHVTFGFFDDGSIGEIFINMNKSGSMLSGLLNCFAIAVSLGIQNARNPKALLDNFNRSFMNYPFEPAGMTDDSSIRTCKSIVDYIVRKIEEYNDNGYALSKDMKVKVLPKPMKDESIGSSGSGGGVSLFKESPNYVSKEGVVTRATDLTGDCCILCGGLTEQAGACKRCIVCGHSQSCG